MRRPRALGVFVDRPWPGATGDMQRVRALVAAVGEVADLRVVLAPQGRAEGGPPPGLDVVEHPRRRDPRAALVSFAKGLPAGRPLMMAFYRQEDVRRAIGEHLAGFDPDLVVTHHLGGASLVDGLVDPTKVILDLPNDEVQRFGRLASMGGAAGRLRYATDQLLTRRWLRHHLGGYRAVTVVSAEDAEAYRRVAPGARIVEVANGTHPPPRVRDDPGGREVLFLGDLAYRPNRDAIEWFIERVLPTAPVDSVRVVGRGEVRPAPRVVALGFVDDLEAELRRATAMIVPLRAGGGTRLKVLEAFGWGIPVVSTALGVEGLGAEPGRHYLQAETPAEWTAALHQVLGDPDLRARLAREARALVDARFTWPQTTGPLRDLVADG